MDDRDLVIKPKKPKGEDGYKTFSVRVKEELVVQIDAMSTSTGRSRNELIVILLEYAIRHCIVEQEQTKIMTEFFYLIFFEEHYKGL